MPDILESGLGPLLLQEWKPTKKQKEFIQLPFEIFEALFGGAAGSGKSDVCLLLCLIYGFHLHPRFKGLILRRTFKDLEQEIIVRSHHWFGPTGAKYNQQQRRWTFADGGMMSFGHAENKDDIRNYDSTELNLVVFEEATHFLDFQYLYLAGSRMRSGTPELPSIVRSSSTPGNVGHNFFRKRFVDPAPDGGKLLVDARSGLKRIFIKALPSDNPHLDPTYIQKLSLLPDAERRAKLGDWYIFEGQVFDTFRPEGPLPDEPANANHVIEPFEIPPYWPKIAAIDWGFRAQTWFGILAISPEGRYYVIHELVFLKENISTWATEIGQTLDEYKNIVEVRLDTNAWQDLGNDESVAAQFERFSGYRPVPADKGKGSRVSGKLLLQECLRFVPKPKRKFAINSYSPLIAERILRDFGVAKQEEYLNTFKEVQEETNLPILQIFRTCKSLIETIPLCVYDTKDSAVEDVKEFRGDDAYDGIRYLLRAARDYIEQAKNAFHAVQKMDKIQHQLQATGDMTGFYRQMENLDSANNNQTYAVLRNRRRTT